MVDREGGSAERSKGVNLISRHVRFVAMVAGFVFLAIAALALILPNLRLVLRSIDRLRAAGSDTPLFEAYLAAGYLVTCVGVSPLCLPLAPIVIGAGGAIVGFLLSMLEISIGSLAPFPMAQRLAGPALENIDARLIKWFRRGFARNEFQFLVLMRIVPRAPFPVTTVIAGARKVEVTKFAFATALGFVPLGLSLSAVGHGLMRLAGPPHISTLDFPLNRDFLRPSLVLRGLRV